MPSTHRSSKEIHGSHLHPQFEDYKESNRSGRTLISISGLFVWTLQVIYLMDKSWINILNRLDPLYENGAKKFLHFASLDRPDASAILCPCRKCRNMKFVRKDLIVEHIVVDGFLTSYTSWIYHGEELFSSKLVNQLDKGDEMQDMLHETFGIPPTSNFVDKDTSAEGFDGSNQHNMGFDKKTEEFFSLLKEVEQLLKDVLPEGEALPKSFYDSKKIIKDLGLEYKKIHACPNDCMIYWNETKDRTSYKFCKAPRYKQFKGAVNSSSETSKIPSKVFRYFPLIPRLQRLFMSAKTSTQMRWHAEGRTRDGVIRHPADSIAWRKFDEAHTDFARDSRNVRLGLASDVFSPFKSMSIPHSTWTVILIPYNLPPWLCMKQPYMILSTIIDGPCAPGNDIDVYLQPLVDELKELWVGVATYDASNNHMFQMRVALLWTISDFPALGNLSGYGVKTRYGCPCCLTKTKSRRLKNGRKYCFMFHRRWLSHGHKFRKDKVACNGLVELDGAPKRLTGIEILKQLNNIKNKFGKDLLAKSRKRKWDDVDNLVQNIWNKKSIFFELEYWKDNMIRHNLDTMHIEKNFFDNIFWTLLNIDGKGKYNLNSCLDLQEMGIRKALHLKKTANGKYYLPPACFTLSNTQKGILLQVLKDVKVPDGYASNISSCVDLNQCTMHGLKSHDCHILMQQLLPIALWNLLPVNVLKPLIELSNFFRGICSKDLKIGDLEKLQDRVAITLCHLERIFPPSFFDIMEHLLIHLAEKAMLGGPSQYRSMWFIERFLLCLKNYVRNKRYPEGSIAEGHWIDELMTFCSWYLDDVETKSNPPLRNDVLSNETTDQEGRRSSREKGFMLDDITRAQAHIYILFNSTSTTSYPQQVFYVDHPMEKEWRMVVKLKPRGFYDLGDDTPTIEHKEGHMELWPEQQLDDTTFETEEDIEWVREGVPGLEIDPETLESNEAYDEDDNLS
ncbi:hypothetical protein MTR67_051749 [Solanum verrucosum]|uniref:Uncharacterized protein n=1 Tax=Solanum verrucosum TaxID=315347 RepID=A0AAF0V760_SOLVR|nr:hypothetical protein MTR67_051749 [Solanum verrucosum]